MQRLRGLCLQASPARELILQLPQQMFEEGSHRLDPIVAAATEEVRTAGLDPEPIS